MNAKTTMKLLAFGVVALLFVGLAAHAQDATTTATITVGGEAVTGDHNSSRFEQYQEYPSGLVLFGADFLWNAKSGYYFSFSGDHLGFDDQGAIFTWGKKSVFKLDLTLSENPRWFSNMGRSFWGERSPGVLNYLNGEVAPVDLRYKRSNYGLAFDYLGLENWDFKFNYNHETRRGHQAFMTSAENYFEQAAPVDYLYQNYSASANWAEGRWFAGATYSYNKFENNIPTLFVNYPNPPNAASPYKYNLAPDSNAWTFALNGGVNLPYHHRLVATIDWGRIKSDTTLLPNAFTPTFDGEVGTFLGQIRLTGEPITWFGYSASYRQQELDNNSAYYIIGAGAAGRGTRAVGYKKTDWKAEVHFDPIQQVRFGLEYNHEKTDHQFREFVSTTENTWKATLDLNYAPWVSFRASYADKKHKDGGFNEAAEELMYPFGGVPVDYGGTQYDIERHNTKIFNAMLVVTPTANLNFTLSGLNNKTDYPDSYFGLQNSKYDNWGLGVDYAWTDRLTLYANYLDEGYNNDIWAMYMNRTTPVVDRTNEWGHKYDDSIHTYTLGFEFDAVPGKFDFSSDFAHSKAESASAFAFIPGGVGGDAGTVSDGIFAGIQYNAYPLLWNKYDKWTNTFNYHFNKNLSASVAYIMQKYQGDDWSQAIVQPLPPSQQGANLSAWRLLGATVPDYDADIFQFYVKFTF